MKFKNDSKIKEYVIDIVKGEGPTIGYCKKCGQWCAVQGVEFQIEWSKNHKCKED